MGVLQCSVGEAITDAPVSVMTMHTMAKAMRRQHNQVDRCKIERHWMSGLKSHLYHTHIAISEQDEGTLSWLTGLFYHTASQTALPWYPAFLGGQSETLSIAPADGIDEHQLCWAKFDLGLGKPRYYRQLLSLGHPNPATAVVAARSVDCGPVPPEPAILAYTLSPNGEVLHWDEARQLLHWHHICCSPGASLLPGRLDQYLMNTLRFCGLDMAERKTYREEAEKMCDWLQAAASRDFQRKRKWCPGQDSNL